MVIHENTIPQRQTIIPQKKFGGNFLLNNIQQLIKVDFYQIAFRAFFINSSRVFIVELEITTFLIDCSATGFAIPRATNAFNASCSKVLPPNASPGIVVDNFAILSLSSRISLSAVFLPIPFTLSSKPALFCTIALLISSGFILDNIILAVAAPTPETLISITNISFSIVSKK